MSREPLADVMKLGRERHTFAVVMAVLFALFVHGIAGARLAMINVDLLTWTHALRLAIGDKLAATYDIEIEKPKPAPPPPPPEEPKEEPKEAPKAPPPKANEPPPPPPAAAQAGKVLTQEPDPSAPVDFTNTFVVGSGDQYAGGVTQAAGTSTSAVYNRYAQAGGVAGGTGTKPSAATTVVDRSRALSVRSKDWHCDFPPEADSEQIDEMVVPTEVSVSAEGRVTNARATKDPGFGFARAAMQCALRQSGSAFDLALDRDGTPIAGTRVLLVHFSR
jgi:protein TonB